MNNTNIFVVLRNILVEKTSFILTNNLVSINKDEFLSSHPKHFFHIVDPSPWPFCTSISALVITLSGTAFMHDFAIGSYGLLYGFLFLLYTLYCWFRDVIFEGTVEGCHTKIVQSNLRMGFKMFIASEVMFFFGFFWAFFHSALSPSINIGCKWPPVGIEVLDPTAVPLLNTIILLVSGAAITWGHAAFRCGMYKESIRGLSITALLAILFLYAQFYEYTHCNFDISDGIYGSVFFMLTGFHGFHVFLGLCMILVSTFRVFLRNMSNEHHLGLEFTVWYWHFVDVVWIFVYIFVYVWGNSL